MSGHFGILTMYPVFPDFWFPTSEEIEISEIMSNNTV